MRTLSPLKMLSQLAIFAILITSALTANFSYSHRLFISPNTLKTYLLHNTHSSSTYQEAGEICSQYPHGRLAEITSGSGDVEFLGQFVESLDEPYWIGGLADSSTTVPCAAIYSGGAVAIPKPSALNQSPCIQKLNVLCEISS